MKKILIFILLTALFLVGCQKQASANSTTPIETTQPKVYSSLNPIINTDVLIGELKAKEIALTDAGYTEEEVSPLYVEVEYDDGVPKYEVTFMVGNLEYEYEIHGKTGEILSCDQDIDD